MVPIIGILVIAALSAFAMHKGIDGKGFALAIGLIAGLAGYRIKDILNLFGPRK